MKIIRKLMIAFRTFLNATHYIFSNFLSISLLTFVLFIFSACTLFSVSKIPDIYTGDVIFDKTIREIKIEGLKYTKEFVVYRSLASKVSQTYTKQTAELDLKRLSQLGIFTSAQFKIIDEDSKIDLIVILTEVNPYVPSPSFKITDQNGLEIGVAFSSPNLFGSASNLSAWIRGGGALNVGLRFKYPWYPGGNWWSGQQTDYFHVERYDKIYQFNESSDEVKLSFLPNISQYFRLGPQISYLYLKSDNPEVTLNAEGIDQILGLGLSVQYDSRNLRTYATQGWWTEVLISYFGSGANFWQGNIDLRKYIRLGNINNSLALYSLLTMTSGTVGQEIPEYLQFNIGGTNTIRGWSLGAREGKNQFINTAEYWHILIKPKVYHIWFIKQILALQGAVFIDTGTAWSAYSEFYNSWILGGGVGIRLITALGISLRLDVSMGEAGMSFGLNIGSSEKAVIQRDRIR